VCCIASVIAAGITGSGTISAIRALAVGAQQYGLWFHVDTAPGDAWMFTEKHKHELRGKEKADAGTVYFHKLFRGLTLQGRVG
jgi:L-2,4-diaminobutyrate decarboxylase